MRISESYLRNLVRQVLAEDLASFTKQIKGAGEFFGQVVDPTFENQPSEKKKARRAKQVWNAEADHAFFDTLTKVHWFQFSPMASLDWILKSSGKDEISTMLYLPGAPFITLWGNNGVIVKGRVTLAANSMNSIVSGYRPNKKHSSKYAASGFPKRPTRMTAKTSENYILDSDSFKVTDQGNNEGIVDNWKPVALVLPYGIGATGALARKAKDAGLDIVDERGKEI
tara:strand:- start:545 stop:1222 length:678 start_codon:yes stop_codon:yes gene_type:complete